MNEILQLHVADFFEISDGSGSLVAIVVRQSFAKPGVNFLSQASFPIQLGVSQYKKGHLIEPHIHLERKIIIEKVQEVVHVDSGSTIVELYDSQGMRFEEVKLASGDTIFFLQGGHSFRMLEDTKLIEVKQGPYVDKKKDKRFIK